jgi:hypothetical protein
MPFQGALWLMLLVLGSMLFWETRNPVRGGLLAGPREAT